MNMYCKNWTQPHEKLRKQQFISERIDRVIVMSLVSSFSWNTYTDHADIDVSQSHFSMQILILPWHVVMFCFYHAFTIVYTWLLGKITVNLSD